MGRAVRQASAMDGVLPARGCTPIGPTRFRSRFGYGFHPKSNTCLAYSIRHTPALAAGRAVPPPLSRMRRLPFRSSRFTTIIRRSSMGHPAARRRSDAVVVWAGRALRSDRWRRRVSLRRPALEKPFRNRSPDYGKPLERASLLRTGQGGSALKALRCAIYTRKSSEGGLEQSFNSLDAQREACAAYIVSQKGEG